jgi:rhomboid protease GluP
MSYGPPESSQRDVATSEPRTTGLRLPVVRPLVTYVLLGVIIVVFIADLVLTQLAGNRIVFIFGAQANQLIGAGQYWRLISPIFLHASLTHLAFNAYALYVLGRDTEGIYGHVWFTVIYFLSGIAGNVAWYVLGSADPSVGASGAIFGLVGAEAAFFVMNRALFGAYAKQRLMNVAVLVVINLIFGFTASGINNLAHLGGLAGGFLLGIAMAPKYAVGWSQDLYGSTPRLIDNRTDRQRIFFAVLAAVVLLALTMLGNQRWA